MGVINFRINFLSSKSGAIQLAHRLQLFFPNRPLAVNLIYDGTTVFGAAAEIDEQLHLIPQGC
jgi:hypothetical protein